LTVQHEGTHHVRPTTAFQPEQLALLPDDVEQSLRCQHCAYFSSTNLQRPAVLLACQHANNLVTHASSSLHFSFVPAFAQNRYPTEWFEILDASNNPALATE
jgi:hypothetical protein